MSGCNHKKHLESQIAEISDRIKEDSTNVDLFFQRIDLYGKLALTKPGMIEREIPDVERILQIDPRSKRAYFIKGLLALDKDNNTGAIAAFSRAIAIDSSYYNPVSIRAICYSDAGKFDSAADDWSRAIALKPGEIINYELRANSFIALGQYERAIADLRKGIASGDTIDASSDCLLVGELSAAMNKNQEALILFDKSAQLDRRINPQLLFMEGVVLFRIKNFQQSQSFLEKAAVIPDSSAKPRYISFAMPHYYLSLLYLEMGDRKKALEQFDLALSNGFCDFDLLANVTLKKHKLVAEFRRRASVFVPSKEMREKRTILKNIVERGYALSQDEHILAWGRQLEIAVEPTKQAEYQTLCGVCFRQIRKE